MPETPDALSDPITFAVIKNAMDAIVDEVAYTVIRTARSEIVKDVMDYSAAICDAKGEMVAQAKTIAQHLGAIPEAMAAVQAKWGGRLQPGDAVIMNDPYSGGMHLPDIFMFFPIFDGVEILAWSVVICHHTDVGGRVPGSNAADSTEIYQEGLRIPPLKLFRDGVMDETLEAVIGLNVRVPDRVIGDLRAQYAACQVGAREIGRLVARYGAGQIRAYLAALLDYAERMARAEIATWPKGTYRFTDHIDSDGLSDDPVPLTVAVTVRGDGTLKVDWEGTSRQVWAAINSTLSFTKSSTFLSVRCALRGDIPNNAGVFRCIEVAAPEGSVLNPISPAPVAARALTGYRVMDTMFGALAQIVPHIIPAGGEGGNTVVCLGGRHPNNHPFIIVDMISGCWGGRPDQDGIEAITNPSQNLSNTPVEVLERQHPVRIEDYALVPDSGGVGRFRGGLGLRRSYRLLADEAVLQLRADRLRFPPYGLDGGEPGGLSGNWLGEGSATRAIPGKVTMTMRRGELLTHHQVGGGGHGDPFARAPEAVARDVWNAKVTVAAASVRYGVAVNEAARSMRHRPRDCVPTRRVDRIGRYSLRKGALYDEDADGSVNRRIRFQGCPPAMRNDEPTIALSEPSADEIKTTTCYMCACRCGIRVHLKDGSVHYIDGNRDHPVNRGVICAKGASGIMTHTSPSRLRAPLKRVGPRGSGDFQEISWDEALATGTGWLKDARQRDPQKLAFFTGRDQSQALTGWFAQQYGTANFAAHGGFCSVNMAAAGLYTFGGSFWEFGEPDWPHTRYFMLFGVAEDHASNPLKIELGKLKAKGVKVVAVNPIRTGYGAIADEWIGIKPGTDGLFAGALIHELLRAEKVDLDYLVRYTNAPWLVIDDPGTGGHGLFARDTDGKPLAFDKTVGALVDATRTDISPALVGTFKLADGRTARPSFALIAERYLAADYTPDTVAARTGITADTIRRIARELAHAAFEQTVTLDQPWTDFAGRRHDKTVGRPVSMHAMRGISAHSNGFQTCRTLHLLQILLGSIDCPGGFRYKAPFPKPTPPPNRPAHPGVSGEPLKAPPLGFPQGPEDLLVDADGKALRIDKAYSWDAPIAAHGLMHTVITNAATADPYPVDVLFMYMANMSWNSSMNIPAVLEHLTAKNETTGEYKIPKIIYSDAYYSEMVAYADLILPDTTYLERWDCISLLDRPISGADAPADAIRQPVVVPDRDVRPFQSVLLDLGARLKLPGFVNDDGAPRYSGGYPDYIVNHQRGPGVGSLAGFRGEDGMVYGKGAPNPKQLDAYIANGCFHEHELAPEQRYYKHANKAYLDWAAGAGFIGASAPVTFQLYLEPLQKFRLAAQGHGAVKAPASHQQRVAKYFDPIPFWYPPFESEAERRDDFPFAAITQRPMHIYHSWGSHNGWIRQITAENCLYVHRARARALGIADGDWVWIKSAIGRVKGRVRLMEGVNPDTVWTWNAIGRRGGAAALGPGAPEATRGFLLNHLIAELLPQREGGYRFSNSDPITGQAAWYDLRVQIEKAAEAEAGETSPRFERLHAPALAEAAP